MSGCKFILTNGINIHKGLFRYVLRPALRILIGICLRIHDTAFQPQIFSFPSPIRKSVTLPQESLEYLFSVLRPHLLRVSAFAISRLQGLRIQKETAVAVQVSSKGSLEFSFLPF